MLRPPAPLDIYILNVFREPRIGERKKKKTNYQVKCRVAYTMIKHRSFCVRSYVRFEPIYTRNQSIWTEIIEIWREEEEEENDDDFNLNRPAK